MSVPTRWFGEFQAKLPRMDGQRVAVTGTTSGTGLVAARMMVRQGAEVLMLNRESERAQKAVVAIKAEFPEAKVHHIACDLMDFASVREAARVVRGKCSEGGLDVLCCNAGVYILPETPTKDGFDVQMQTNHLSNFLLVKELLPCLRMAEKGKGEARIVHVSSIARKGPLLDANFFAKNGEKTGEKGWFRYHQSKLANIIFTYALADKLAANGQNIKALVVTPGICETPLYDETMGFVNKCCCCFKKAAMQSPEDGAMPLLMAAAMKEDVQQGDLILPSMAGEKWGPATTLRRPLQAKEEAPCQDVPSQKLLWDKSEEAICEKFEL